MVGRKVDSNDSWKSGHYMTPRQLDYFRQKLLDLKTDLEISARKTLHKIKDYDARPIEEMERSALAFDRDIEIQNQARNWTLVKRIDEALEQIENGTYGYCQETEEPIGIKRLEANPISMFCLDVQERLEMAQGRPRHRFY